MIFANPKVYHFEITIGNILNLQCFFLLDTPIEFVNKNLYNLIDKTLLLRKGKLLLSFPGTEPAQRKCPYSTSRGIFLYN